MCVSVAAASFASTLVYAGEARLNGRIVHVAGYQNEAQSHIQSQLRRGWWDRPRQAPEPIVGRGNAMVLHFPAVSGTMTQANVLDTERCPFVLDDMATALSPPEVDTFGSDRSFLWRGSPRSVEVFESGIYTVVLAADARAIPAALDQVPIHKRPPLNPGLFDWYHETFPGWPVALCCFDNTERVRATPMLWWYEPAYPEWLFAPAVDAHTGAPPDLASSVLVDHWVIAGSSEMADGLGTPVRYRGTIPHGVSPYLPDRVVGEHLRGPHPNADFVVRVADVRQGRFDAELRLLAA